MKIFALEGLPCSGKSTVMNKFKFEHTEFVCVPELYIETNVGDDSILIQDKYVNAEIAKYREHGKSAKNILFDRSIFSTLAFSYAKFLTFRDPGEYEFYKKFVKDRHELLIPNYIFVINITPSESIARRKKLVRDDTLDFWTNERYLKNFLQYYSSSDICEFINKKNIFFIDSQSGDESTVYDAFIAHVSAI